MGGDDKKSKEKMEETRRTRKAGPHAVGREGSKRSGVAATGVMVGLRKRWIRMELGLLMMGAESPVGRR